MKISEIYEKGRKKALKLCVVHAALAIIGVLCLAVLIYAGKSLVSIPAFAIGLNLHYFFSNLKAARELEVKKRETEKMEEKLENLGRGQK